MLGKSECRRRRGQQRIKWLDGITNSMDMLLLPLLSHFSRVRLCATPETAAHQAPRPWDSPGKNTGVCCNFLLQCMKMKSESEVAQSCLTLSDPMDCSPPGSSIHGIFQARVLEWGTIAFSAMDMSLSKFLELVIDRKSWHATVYGVSKSWT